MKCNNTDVRKQLWVAVKVERGFICEAKVFESEAAAKRIERRWRVSVNPDYDEVAVIKTHFIPMRANSAVARKA